MNRACDANAKIEQLNIVDEKFNEVASYRSEGNIALGPPLVTTNVRLFIAQGKKEA